jgi:hypothetical protein
MHRTIALCVLAVVLLALAPVHAQNSPVPLPVQARLPLLLRPANPSTNLDVTTASYLGGAQADTISAAALAPDGSVLLAGAFPAFTPPGVTVTNLISGGNAGALIHLSADGRKLLGIATLPSQVRDMEVNAAGKLVACGDFGVARLDARASRLDWLALPGPVTRCAIAADGTVAALDAGSAYVYDDRGSLLKNWSIAGSARLDIAIDGLNRLVIASGYTQKNVANQCSGLLQVAWARAWSYDGQSRWTIFDWTAQQAQAANLCADTRGERVVIGEDGRLYFVGSINGGTGASIFAHDPRDITQRLDGTRLIVTDEYTNPFNTGSVKMAWFARLDPATGALERAQSLLTRLSSNRGNSISIRAIDADGSGRVFLAGSTACCIKQRSGTAGAPQTLTVGGVPVGNYAGGEAFFLALSSDFQTRLAWSVFAAPGLSAGDSPADALTVGEEQVLIGATLNVQANSPRGLITIDPLQASPASPDASEAYFVLWPLPPHGGL